MGEDPAGPQIPNLHFDFSPSLLDPINLDQKIGVSSCINHSPDMILANEVFPVDTVSKLLQWRQTNRVDESQGWFYCFPRFRQAITPALNTIVKDEAARESENNREREKRFFVVDQSPDQTTLIFNSHLQCLSSWSPGINNMNSDEDFRAERKWTNDFDGKEKADVESEMKEDTEELNALLYSDDEEESRESSEEDEVTSTGHSPSRITTSYNKGCSEEVAGSFGPIKKRKAFERCDIDREDDAESCCGGDMDGKKMKKERIKEIVGMLQSIVPCSHGKEASVVIDESIQYLKYLKSSKPWL